MSGIGKDGQGITAKVAFQWNLNRCSKRRQEVHSSGGQLRSRGQSGLIFEA